jgi:aldehyde dehydrogenase (NAD+)
MTRPPRAYCGRVHDHDRLYIGGKWEHPATSDLVEVSEAATGEVLGSVPAAGAADVDRAVAAAAATFEGWAATPVAERAAALGRLHAAMADRLVDFGGLIASEVGMPAAKAMVAQAGVALVVVESYVDLAATFAFEEAVGNAKVVYEPVGVVAAVTPWNYPLLQAVSKVAPALLAGCPVVLKPSEVAPLSLFLLAELVDAAGFPPGTFNLVTGTGAEAGEALVAHPGVDKVSFTGSTPVGRRVAQVAGASFKRLTLELGGKSASVVLDDADLDEAVRASVLQAMLNSGQMCMAWSRLVVPRERHDEAARLAAKVAEQLVVGDPFSPATDVGPLASGPHRDRVRAAIEAGVAEGATLVAGGPEPPAGLERGYYVRPTIFADVTEHMSVATEEIFGPVVAVMAHDGDGDAVRIANSSPFGLHGAVFSGDRARAEGVARRLRTGQVDVCGGGGFNPWAPFGGYKESGWGRELGRWGLEGYLETKALQFP